MKTLMALTIDEFRQIIREEVEKVIGRNNFHNCTNYQGINFDLPHVSSNGDIWCVKETEE